jgi:quinol-cytochrome oxidoreductase complex cytochrome b subunit
LHYLLPFVIAAFVVLHVWALHVAGQNNPDGVEVKDVERDTVAFTPYATIKDLFAVSLYFVLYAWLIFYIPNYLLDADNSNIANPLVTPAHVVPEWYLLPYYAILRAIPNKLMGVIALVAAIAVLAVLPWLDRSPVKSAKYRPTYRFFFWVFVAICIGLGYLGSQVPTEGLTLIARILTAGYFAFFLIVMPVLSFTEKTKPIPASIAEAVLAKTKAAAAAVG